MNIQYKKGILELCVLTLLTRRDHYGYELVETISKSIEISEGTIYPLLRRLSDAHLVETYLQESNVGPPRKYYRLTKKGEKSQQQQHQQWTTFSQSMKTFLQGDDHD